MSYLDEGRRARNEQKAAENERAEQAKRELLEFVKYEACRKWEAVTGEHLDPDAWTLEWSPSRRYDEPPKATAYATLDGLPVFMRVSSTHSIIANLEAERYYGVLRTLADVMEARARNGLELPTSRGGSTSRAVVRPECALLANGPAHVCTTRLVTVIVGVGTWIPGNPVQAVGKSGGAVN
jgi:hypothetical protein